MLSVTSQARENNCCIIILFMWRSVEGQIVDRKQDKGSFLGSSLPGSHFQIEQRQLGIWPSCRVLAKTEPWVGSPAPK